MRLSTIEGTSNPTRPSTASQGVTPAVSTVASSTGRLRVSRQAVAPAAATTPRLQSAAGSRSTVGVSGRNQVRGASR